MTTQHTPGPWAVDDTGYRAPGNGLCVMAWPECVAVVGANNPHLPQDANARLIAAAPDLLEALKAMEDRFGCRSSRQEDQPKTYGCHHMAETCTQCEGLVTGWKAVQAARAAINKARGETKS